MRLRINSLGLMAALLPAMLVCDGCQWAAQVLGYPGKYVLVGDDVLTPPGQDVRIEARLRKASTFDEPSPQTVYFFLDANMYQAVRTDSEGNVAVHFRPPAPGDYWFRLRAYRRDDPNGEPAEAEVLAACREPAAPLCIVDIDHTLSDAGSRVVLLGEPNAIAGSVAALARVSGRYTVIYLTLRSDYLGRKTRLWLRRQGYPEGPILAAREPKQMFGDNQKYKEGMLEGIRRQFNGPGYGIGDQASDVLAYVHAGLQGVLFIDLAGLRTPSDVADALEQLRSVPDTAQVACSWDEFDKIVLEGASFPPASARQRVQNKLDELKRRP
jgi:hypothetical protein